MNRSWSAIEILRNRGRFPYEEYIQLLSEAILRELRSSGRCDALDLIVPKSSAPDINFAYTENWNALMLVCERLSGMQSAETYPELFLQSKSSAFRIMLPMNIIGNLLQTYAAEQFGKQREERSPAPAAPPAPASQIEASAEREELKNRLYAEAKVDAERYRQQLRQQYEEEAERYRQQLRQQYTEEAEREAELARQSSCTGEIRRLLEDCRNADIEADAETARERAELARAFENTRSAVCGEIKQLQAGVVSQLGKLLNDTASMMDAWRVSMYKTDASGLATCYVEFQAVLRNLDEQIAALSGKPQEEYEALCRPIVNIRNNLRHFDKKLCSALLGVGLDVYRPKEGDEFDPVWHITENDDGTERDDVYGRIRKCIYPGVRMYNAQSKEYTPLIRAEVTLTEGDFNYGAAY